MSGAQRVYIAANNAEIGGGEVMLLAIAEGLRSLGLDVTVVGPESPDGVLGAAESRGLDTVALPAADRFAYMRALREWRKRNRGGLLWCNGLAPAAATAGMRDRIVHLHQVPSTIQRPLAFAARAGALCMLAPSATMAQQIPAAKAFHNWSAEVERAHSSPSTGPIRLGFLGRPSEAKGIPVLVDAVKALHRTEPGRYKLRIAGEPRFVDARERAVIDGQLRSMGGLGDRVGWMPADEFLGAIDVLVVPSIAPESFGLVASEAMSAKVPLVVSDAGALPEVVGADHPWIARAGDSVDLARVIREAVSALPAHDVVARAHERWQRLFSPDAGRNRLRALLADLGVLK